VRMFVSINTVGLLKGKASTAAEVYGPTPGRPRGFAEVPRSGEINTSPTPPRESFASPEMRLRVAVEHTKLFEELLGDIKNFAIMKKHFKAYVEGFPGAKELRIELMEAESAKQVEEKIHKFLKQP